MGLATLVQAAAGLSRLGLYGDGAYCLREVLTARWFGCIEAPRRTIQMVLEAPTIAALRLGITDLPTLAVIFSLTIQLTPLLLTALCLASLWPQHRTLAILPALHYFAGSAAIGSAGLIEGPSAAAYAWLLLALILFRSTTPSQRGLLWAASLPAAFGHEAMLLLAPGLAAAAILRAQDHMPGRFTMNALAAWFLAVAALQLRYTLAPRDAANRNGFVEQLLGFHWLWAPGSGLNTIALLGLLGLAAVALIAACPHLGRPVAAMYLGLAALLCLGALNDTSGRAPILQFFARNQPSLISIPLGVAMLLLRSRPASRLDLAVNPATSVLLGLALSTSLLQVATAYDWSAYLSQFEIVLRDRTGIVSQEEVLATLPAADRARFGRMAWGWTYPDLSLLLSPRGAVETLVANPQDPLWQPWNPRHSLNYPKSQLWRYGAFSDKVEQ